MSKRIEFEFSDNAFQRLDAIKRTTGRPSYAIVVSDALRLFEWYTSQMQAGYQLGLVRYETLLIKTVTIQFDD